MRTALIIFPALLLCSGCIETARHMHTFVFQSGSDSFGDTISTYHLLGTRGPDALWLENERGVRQEVHFDLFSFPDREDWLEMGISSRRGEHLKNRAEKLIVDYFGSRREVKIQVAKATYVDGQEMHYLMDAICDLQPKRLGETLIGEGLALVNEDLVELADLKVYLKLQDRARRSKVGIWADEPVHNPTYRD